jgi:polyisoprenoid-binding protein YceI
MYKLPLWAIPFLIAASLSAKDFAVKADSSEISFYVPAKITNVRGYFRDFKLGKFSYDEKKGFASARGEFIVNTASVFTRDRKRDDHLRADDFFHTAKYPQAIIRIHAIRAKIGDDFEADITLQIRNKTKDYKIPLKIQTIDKNNLRVSGSFVINRKTFDLTGNHIANIIMKDDVETSFRLQLTR